MQLQTNSKSKNGYAVRFVDCYDTMTMSHIVAGQVRLLWRDKQCCIWYLYSHQYRCRLNTGSTDGTGADTPCHGCTERRWPRSKQVRVSSS